MTASRDDEIILDDRSNLSWVKTGITQDYFFSTPPVDIDASIDTVWAIVKDVNHYSQFSAGTVKAKVKGEVGVGKKISLDLKGIPTSDEIITEVDDDEKILGWERSFSKKVRTERYHILEPLADDKTRSYIALKIPKNCVGQITNFFFRKPISKAFKDLNEGIKKEAERTPDQLTL